MLLSGVNNRRRTAIFFGLGVLLAGLAFFLLPREPTYQAKSLNEWLKEFDRVPIERFQPPSYDSAPSNAIAGMSTELKVKYGPAPMLPPTNAFTKMPTELAAPTSFNPYLSMSKELHERYELDNPLRLAPTLPLQPDPNPFQLYPLQLQITSTTAVVKAVRKMGPDALPKLLTMARAKDSWFKQCLTTFSQKYSPVEIYFTPAYERRSRAHRALFVLGRSATPVIPSLTKLLNPKT